MVKSTETVPSRKPPKPEKPYAGFPLFAHSGSGQWAKKIRKRLVYFGSYRADPDGSAALESFNKEWPFLKEGRTPPVIEGGCTLKALVNDFLRSKEEKLKAGELSPRTFRDYYKTCEGLIAQFGRERLASDLRPDDFRTYRAKLAERLGVVSRKNEINRVCILFNYAHDNELIDKPVSYGQCFERPSAKELRRDRNQAGPRLFTREEILRLLDAADAQLKAMTLLGVNCGFGNTDVSTLPLSALDLERGRVTFPRPKTHIQRRIPLWPETIEALKTALAVRPRPTEPAAKELVFLTRLGRPWVRVKPPKPKKDEDGKPEIAVPIDALSGQFAKLLRRLKINGRRGLGFYACRHCFETYAGESKDQVAVNAVMGHVDDSMPGVYRHGVSDERLQAVVGTVRAWLFAKEGGDA